MPNPALQRRNRKDRMTGPDIAAAQHAVTIDHIVGPLDRVKRRLDQKWGVDRLPELMRPDDPQKGISGEMEWLRKFGLAVETFERAMMKDVRDPEEIKDRVSNLIKGYTKLDEIATAAGAEPMVPESVSILVNNQPAAIAFDAAARREIQRLRPDLTMVWTLDEIERLLSADAMKLVNEAKRIFAEADVISISDAKHKRSLRDELEDEIPF